MATIEPKSPFEDTENGMLVPKGSYVLAADGGKQRLYRNDGAPDEPRLVLLSEKEHRGDRTSWLGTDRPGRSFESMGHRSASYETTDFHQQAEDEFAITAARSLEEVLARPDNSAILIAAPRTLGVIRKNLEPWARKRLLAEIPKDRAASTAAELAHALQHHEK